VFALFGRFTSGELTFRVWENEAREEREREIPQAIDLHQA
jgi:hypothetical protein